jgi:hypothetical protein
MSKLNSNKRNIVKAHELDDRRTVLFVCTERRRLLDGPLTKPAFILMPSWTWCRKAMTTNEPLMAVRVHTNAFPTGPCKKTFAGVVCCDVDDSRLRWCDVWAFVLFFCL